VRVAVTGADGFLGWHIRCALKARSADTVVAIGRRVLSDPAELDRALRGVSAVIHVAGVNRADRHALLAGNVLLAKQLTDSLERVGSHPVIVFANSIQSGNGTPYGEGKQAAADLLTEWAGRHDTSVADVRLPNLFGEHGRPHYNSVVATFCHELVHRQEPVIVEDREVPLLHAQDAADCLLALTDGVGPGSATPAGRAIAVSTLLRRLRHFRDLYASGDIPDITDHFDLCLFNTYRSFCFPGQSPVHPPLRADPRGQLVECVRGHGGKTQVFCSTTRAGVTRGDHFHLRKVERFIVLHGTAEIALRRLFDNAIVRYEVSGARPAMVDMPTLWAHRITNRGNDELITLFWCNEVFDPDNPDTYPEPVESSGVAA
jgi:UDP-2-acetamido-2,6-beta-L-arabino-hexul-4-ose reductase